MDRLWRIFKTGVKYSLQRPIIFVVWICAVVISIVFDVLVPQLEADYINTIVYSGNSDSYITYLFFLALALIFRYSLPSLASHMRDVMLTRDTHYYAGDIIKHLQKTSMLYLNQKSDSYFSSKVRETCGSVISLFYWFLGSFLNVLITMLAVSVAIFQIEYRVGLLLLLMIIVNYIACNLMSPVLYNSGIALQERGAESVAARTEQFTAAKFIKTNGIYNYFSRRLTNAIENCVKAECRANLVSFEYLSINKVVKVISKVGMYALVGIGILSGDLKIGTFTVLLRYVELLIEDVEETMNAGTKIQKALASYDQLEKFLQVPAHTDGSAEPTNINCVEFKNLSFDYGKKPIFKEFNLSLKKGKLYGLHGENGAGKSTLLNLMLGLYMGDYTGEICFDGIDIKDINLTKCKQTIIGVTEQEPLLMKDTLYNNICLGRQYDRDKIYQYGKMIGLTSYFDKLPDGLDTEINDKSTNISGGEKQKISILRQMLKNPDIMIFDEPTSALDAESVKLFMAYIEQVKRDKIIIMISHDEAVQDAYDETISITKYVPEVAVG